MPEYDENISRSNYYGINGVVDVLTSMKINKSLEQTTLGTYDNKIIEILKKDPNFQKIIQDSKEGDDYEIIIDYKGMKIVQDDTYFNFSLDSVLLPNFVTIKTNTNKILDLGTGNAPIPLIFSCLNGNADIYGIEIQKEVYTSHY